MSMMPPAILRSPVWAWAVPSVVCVSLTGVYVFDAAYRQWAEESGWLSLFNAHSPLAAALLAVWACSFGLLILAVGMWLFNLRVKTLPQGRFTAWVLIMALSCASLFPPPADYAAMTVLLLGPGKNSARLQDAAVRSDSLLLLNALVVRGATIQNDLLLIASYQGSPRIVSRLIRLGAPIDAQFSPDNRTALHMAVAGRRYENARVLVEAGARVDLLDDKGQTPVSRAASLGDDEMLRILRAQSREK